MVPSIQEEVVGGEDCATFATRRTSVQDDSTALQCGTVGPLVRYPASQARAPSRSSLKHQPFV